MYASDEAKAPGVAHIADAKMRKQEKGPRAIVEDVDWCARVGSMTAQVMRSVLSVHTINNPSRTADLWGA
jgi:hypothetical protein